MTDANTSNETIVNPENEAPAPAQPASIPEKPAEDVKEQRREGYAQRKLVEAETTITSLSGRMKEMETKYALSEAMRKYDISEEDVSLILDDDPSKILEKAEKLSLKFKELAEKKEAEVTEKIEKSSPTFAPKYRPIEGATNKEKAKNLAKQLFGE